MVTRDYDGDADQLCHDYNEKAWSRRSLVLKISLNYQFLDYGLISTKHPSHAETFSGNFLWLGVELGCSIIGPWDVTCDFLYGTKCLDILVREANFATMLSRKKAMDWQNLSNI
jgi:hypothetical protein